MNRVQELLLQRKIQKSTEKNKKEKQLKSIYRRQKELAEKNSKKVEEGIEHHPDPMAKKKLDFYNKLFKSGEDLQPKRESPKTDQGSAAAPLGPSQVSKNSKNIKKYFF